MKTRLQCTALLLVCALGFSCNSKAKKEETATQETSCCAAKADTQTTADATVCTQKIADNLPTVYYFHGKRRCITCEAVEKVSKELIVNQYAGKAQFVSIDREDEQNKALLDRFQVSGQTLLVVQANEVKNITKEAFMYARSNPEKLQALLSTSLASAN